MRRVLFILLVFISYYTHAQQLADGFNDQIVISNFNNPVGIEFDENGQLYVWEKSGLIHIVDTNHNKLATPLLDIREEVGNWADHGLLGFALDPNFMSNGYYYIMYAVDKYHLLFYGTPSYSPDSSRTNVASIGRIVRYKADAATNFTTTLPNSRTVLLGETIHTGIPLLHLSHGVGSLVFGTDGTLLVSVGDGSSFLGLDLGGDSRGAFATQAIADGILSDDQDIGSYRSQYLGSLNGKILRLDPATGDGVSSNPFFDPANPRSPQSRIWATGFRNPFKFTVRPGTGSHYPADGNPGILAVGDVGGSSYEEINMVTEAGQNFGWPIYEGMLGEWTFWTNPAPENKMAPNPLYGQNGCTQEYFTFRDLLQRETTNTNWVLKNPCDDNIAIQPSIHTNKETAPIITWSNRRGLDEVITHVKYFQPNGYFEPVQIIDERSQVQGDTFSGICSTGGIFYDGDNFPDEFKGKFFGSDYGNWINIFEIDDSSNLVAVDSFHTIVNSVLDMRVHPLNGTLYYVNFLGEVHKVAYGGNVPPIAIIEADTFYGGNSLTVHFDASQSYDPVGFPITYLWDFGDGNTSTDIQPIHTFTTTNSNTTSFPVTLTITDSLGAIGTDQIVVSLNNTPPDFEFTTFKTGDLYPMNKTTLLGLDAEVIDAEHSKEELTYRWQAFLHHNDHFHPDPPSDQPTSYATISPVGCDGELYYYRVQLTVTDPGGLSTTKKGFIYPNCDGEFILWDNITSTAHANGITIGWATLQEDDVTEFVIQRSDNARDFKKIGTVSASGNNSTYSFEDNQPLLGTNYYRIKAYKNNQAYAYSTIAKDNYPFSGIIDIYPNPVKNRLNIEFNEPAEAAEFQLFNNDGKLIVSQTWENITDNEVKTFYTHGLGGGVYLLTIKMGDTIWTRQVFVER